MADPRHMRVTNARRKPKVAFVAAPIAVVATLASVSVGILASNPAAPKNVSAGSSISGAASSDRESQVSRSESRTPTAAELRAARLKEAREAKKLANQRASARAAEKDAKATARAVAGADTKLWATEDLNIWESSGEAAKVVGEVEAGDQVLVTGREANGRSEIVVKKAARWVTSDYLDDEKPVAGIGGECTNGSSVESGVSPNIVKVHQAVCAAFPDITTYGTFRGDGEHSQGLAVDIMVSGDRGQQVAEFVRSHFSELGVNYIIYSQQIWSVDRGGEGWRGMSDRGSTTANHYDHVHVTTY